MITRAAIQHDADTIAAIFQPTRIVLFGSHAYGTPNADSDVDLLIEPHEPTDHVAAAVAVRQRVPAPFPVDLLVRSADDVAQRLAMGDPFLREITQRGTELYAAYDLYVGHLD